MMTISSVNKHELNDLYLHDSVFDGFHYDYGNCSINTNIISSWLKKQYDIFFQNVVAIQMQSCCFWGIGNVIYDIWIDEDPSYFKYLLSIQEINAEKYKMSALGKGRRFISVIIQLNSGDELRITCESIEICEKDLAYPIIDVKEP